jgi:hypothetical protein
MLCGLATPAGMCAGEQPYYDTFWWHNTCYPWWATPNPHPTLDVTLDPNRFNQGPLAKMYQAWLRQPHTV